MDPSDTPNDDSRDVPPDGSAAADDHGVLVPQPPAAADPRMRLLQGDSSSVFAKITAGDPLQLAPTCAMRYRERAFLIDSDRLAEAAAIKVAEGAPLYLVKQSSKPSTALPLDEWLLDRVDAALDKLLNEDAELLRSGWVPWPSEFRYLSIRQTFAMEDGEILPAVVAFNGLGIGPRRAFFDLLITDKSIEETMAQGWENDAQLQEDVYTALTVLITAGLDPTAATKKKTKKKKGGRK